MEHSLKKKTSKRENQLVVATVLLLIALGINIATVVSVLNRPVEAIVVHIMDVKGCTKKEAKAIYSAINSLYVERTNLTPRKVIQLEGLLSRELFSEIAKYVFNHYEWPESLDSEVDRVSREYRSGGGLGRNKTSVKHYLYKAYALGL